MLKKQGYEDYRQEVRVSAEEFVAAYLTPCIGYLYVCSYPEGASLYVDGQYKGRLQDCVELKLEAGTHEVLIKKEGYKDYVAKVTIETNDFKSVFAYLTPLSSPVQTPEQTPMPLQRLKPLVVLRDLHPRYFAVGDDESYEVSAIACDERGLKKAELLYSRDGKKWWGVETRIASIASTGLFNITSSKPVIYEVEGTIPPQKAGTVIFYKFVVEDRDGNEAESPTGMYFVVDDESEMKVMVVDPWVELWLFKLNAERYAEIASKMTDYGIRAEWLSKAYSKAKKVESLDIIKRHYWERLPYNFIIVSPNEVKEALSFKPEVIILSNLLLSQWVVPHELIGYARENNAGIVATHGTIFDEVVWTADNRRDAKEVGARQNVGDKPDVYTPEKETVALLLGLKLSPAVEYARDVIAESLCSSSQTKAAGRVLGSTPLHPAYVPFSGRLLVKEEHEVVKGLGKEFQITIPGKPKAYTTLGWQYILPPNTTKMKGAKCSKELLDFLNAWYGIQMPSSSDLINFSITDDGRVRIGDREVKLKCGMAAIEFFKKYMPARAIAISDDCLAGVIVHDEWYRNDGVRAVYITFEPEASKDGSAWRLMKNSVEWASKFDYRPEEVTEEMSKYIEQMKSEKPPYGYLKIFSDLGADVYVDGKYVGSVNLTWLRVRVEEGYHDIVIAKDGRRYSDTVYVSRGEVREIVKFLDENATPGFELIAALLSLYAAWRVRR